MNRKQSGPGRQPQHVAPDDNATIEGPLAKVTV